MLEIALLGGLLFSFGCAAHVEAQRRTTQDYLEQPRACQDAALCAGK